MTIAFYLLAAIAVVTTILVITHRNVVHALLYFIVSLLSVAVMFFIIGAPFVAALEVIIYAGAIMVLFLFVVMMLSLGAESVEQERRWTRPHAWMIPGVMCALLLGTLGWVVLGDGSTIGGLREVEPAEVGASLFGPYIWGVHLGALLLLSGLIGASHLRRHTRPKSDPEGGA